jgi:hypothetical protein
VAMGGGQGGLTAQADFNRGSEPAEVPVAVGAEDGDGRLRKVHLGGQAKRRRASLLDNK